MGRLISWRAHPGRPRVRQTPSAALRVLRAVLFACTCSETAKLIWTCALAVILMMTFLNPLAARELRSRYHERGEEGWFWYVEPEPESDIEAEPEPEPPAAVAPTPSPSEAAAAGPAPLSVAWLQENLERYHHRAIDDPTPDNVRAYLLLQRLSMDKASAFSEAVQAVTVGDPFLDATMERPLSSFAVQEVDRASHQARQRLLAHLAGAIGLVFFYDSACPHCAAQAPILEALADATGLQVMAVSVDHRPMPQGAFAVDWTPDFGQAEALGVMTVPAIYAMRPGTAEVSLIAQGAMDIAELTSRILLVARQQGWISAEAFEATRPVTRLTVAPAPDEMLDAAVLEDPAALVAYLRDRMRRP